MNEITVSAVAMEAWKAYNSMDGPGGTRNTVGKFVFEAAKHQQQHRECRSKAAGLVQNPFRVKVNTLAYHATTLWNMSPELRTAPTKNAAATVARKLAREAPP